MPELTRKSQDGTREIFEPIVAQCSRASQYNAANPPDKAKFAFEGLADYWQVARDQPPPVVGNWYTVTLSVNTGANGTKYRDIMLLTPADIVQDAEAVATAQDMQDRADWEAHNPGAPTATQPGLAREAELGLSAPESPNAGAPDWDAIQAAKDERIQGHADAKEQNIRLSAATRDAMIAIQIMEWPVPEGRTFTSWFRECRARLFYAVHDREIEPQFYCYEHGQARNQGSNGYGHPVDGGTCIWEKGIIMDEIYPDA